jgi:hypothetical protein
VRRRANCFNHRGERVSHGPVRRASRWKFFELREVLAQEHGCAKVRAPGRTDQFGDLDGANASVDDPDAQASVANSQYEQQQSKDAQADWWLASRQYKVQPLWCSSPQPGLHRIDLGQTLLCAGNPFIGRSARSEYLFKRSPRLCP